MEQAADDGSETVYLNEENVVSVDAADGVWYIDTGASSYMTGDEKTLTALDKTVHGKVRFGDDSVVPIHGRGHCHVSVSHRRSPHPLQCVLHP